MSNYIRVKIDNVLKGFNSKIPFMQPLYEAITNSLEAHAKDIRIVFEKEELLDNDTMKPKIIGFTIRDNGDGFNKKNRESFGEYLSNYKSEIGCKGIGRFTWLKVFKEIKIESQLSDEYVTIDFDKNYSDDKMKVIKQNSDEKYTQISFKYVTDNYYNKNKDERFRADIVAIKDNIENHLMVKLFLLKEEKKANFAMKHAEQIRMMFLCSLNGMRSINFAYLQVKDVFNDELKVKDVICLDYDKNKGKNKCEYYMNSQLKKEFCEYLKYLQDKWGDRLTQETYLFTSQKLNKPYNRASISRMFSSIYKKFNIKGASHLGRHLFVSKLVNSGVNICLVQKLANHKNISTTQHYFNYNQQMLANAVENVKI